MDSCVLGIDPGVSGALTILTLHGQYKGSIKLNETHRDVWDWLDEYRRLVAFAVLEKVGPMPRQGVSSTFKFGMSYGGLIMLLVAAEIPHEYATPAKWQKRLGCMSKGDKNVTKIRAQQLWPGDRGPKRITHAIADSMLIAEYARRRWHDDHEHPPPVS